MLTIRKCMDKKYYSGSILGANADFCLRLSSRPIKTAAGAASANARTPEMTRPINAKTPIEISQTTHPDNALVDFFMGLPCFLLMEIQRNNTSKHLNQM